MPGADLYGGAATFDFSIKPLGSPGRWTARFDTEYANVDLVQVTDFYALRGLRFAGRAAGRHHLEWSRGLFPENRQDGQITVTMPAGVQPMTASLAAARAADENHALHEWGPFAPQPLAAHLPIAGEVTYRLSPDEVQLEGGRFASERTHVAFQGTTAWSDRLPHSVSRDEQRLAGKRSDPGRHHHGFRIADQPGAVRRAWRVRGRDEWSVSAAARRRAVQRRGSSGVGHRLGRWRRPDRVRERLPDRPRRGRAPGRFGNSRRRPVRGRLGSERGRRDQRAISRDAPRPGRSPPRLPNRRLSGVGPADRRLPPHRRVRAAGRFRRDDDRRGQGVRRAVSEGHGVAALRRDGRQARRHLRSPKAAER